MSAQIADVLDRAAELVERGWCQRAYAVDERGRIADALAPNAYRWCAEGALDRASVGAWFVKADATQLLARVIDGAPISWNDEPERTQAEVADALRRAAALAREKA